MRKSINKTLFLFCFGFMAYITLEVLYRGYSFWMMGICGGLAFLLIDRINNKISWDIDLLVQGLMGSAIITSFEFIIGELSLHNILPVMWDYSDTPMNFKGIICVPFSLIWIALSIVTVILCDAINYYCLNEKETIPYYKLFGKKIFTFH
jgi:uncharacterized membrane protein